MYFALKTDCYFRKYGEIGYITRPIVTMEEVVDEVGAIFLGELGYEPKSIDDIVFFLSSVFVDVDKDKLKKDALEFYFNFVSDGFLNQAESLDEFIDAGFEYSTLNGKLAYSNLKPQVEESSSHFLSEYYKNTPYLHTFHIELTSRCNERCIHCYIWMIK